MKRFTDAAEAVLERAKEISALYGCPFTGSEHVLFAMLGENDCIANKLLTARGITESRIRSVIPQMRIFSSRVGGDCGLTVRLQHILEYSAEQAYRHGSSETGTEHILLAMVSEDECVAARIITECGVKLSEIFADVTSVIGSRNTRRDKKHEKESGYLKQYGRDLCELYRQGKLPPCVGRQPELERITRILCRKTKCNPCLLGEAGVGKTAVVEGLAALIYEGEAPEPLASKTVISVDMASVVSGTKYRGDFEERFRGLLNEAAGRRDVILFIDEIHTVASAGSAEGSIDASNMLKQPLGRGEITVIGATTFSEYEKYIESDPALSRRFQPVIIKEPDPELAYTILCGIRPSLERHHGVTITDGALRESVRLSRLYIKNRALPDKAIDLLDEASSKHRRLGRPVPFTSGTAPGTPIIDADGIAAVFRERTGIGPEEDARILRGLEGTLRQRIIGQDGAISELCSALIRCAAGFGRERGPRASFIFTGPTGAGKTETCRALADSLTKGGLIRFDMSEYMERHSVSRLIGSPPGYVGYGEGGLLTGAVRRCPRCVVCFDEAEKAHPDIYGLFLQILEEGTLTDSRGRKTDFSDAIIILTTNENDGLSRVNGFSSGDGGQRESGFFSKELLNRTDGIIRFDRLGSSALSAVIKKRLDELTGKAPLEITYDPSVCDALAEKCDRSYGARDALRAVTQYVETPLSRILLSGEYGGAHISRGEKDIEVSGIKTIDKPEVLEYNRIR